MVYSSRLRPVLNIRPGTRLWNFNADMMVVEWLDAKGIAHDVVTDEDLDRDGLALLSPYRAVLTGSHPEYLSPAMMAAFEGYLEGGGRLMYLGGNGFYWQIAFHRHERGIVECRKSEGVRNFELEPGERHHSFDGRAGGLWRSRSVVAMRSSEAAIMAPKRTLARAEAFREAAEGGVRAGRVRRAGRDRGWPRGL